MWRSRKFLVVGALIAVLLVGVVGGVVLAADNDSGSNAPVTTPADNSTAKTLLERVAEKLGIDAQQLEDAFTQAQDEMRSEAIDTWLDKLVADGKITQEQADAYRTWLASEPDTSAYRQWLESQPDLGVGRGPMGPGPGMGMRCGPFGFR